ncbi:sensor histidine kinase [Azospirillum canadense]|uniref:sensor histidine kinase n=1 Tax=Azospirillum canadense TaxID=403962 RepID=UPI0022261656|nr:PAS domain S-box protein [Azospirillum canadense]MCW2238467.1 PAS domain S-box-containing protein [Azospirillum canadense]
MEPTDVKRLPWQESILDALDVGIVVLDRHGRVQFWNGWMEAASGVPSTTIHGQELVDALPALRDSRLHTAIRDVLDTGAPSVLSHTLNPVLFPLRCADGRRMVHNVLIRPMTANGARYCVIQVTDVTAVVNRERVLREQRDARYRAIVDTAPDAIVTTDTRGVLQWANGAAAQQFGYRPNELIGQSVSLVLAEGSPDWSSLVDRDAVDRQAPIELIGRRRDGSRIDLEVSLARWESEGRSFITGILRDITERRRTREELKANALAMRQLAEQTKATLDALPAHIAVLDHGGHIISVNKAWAEGGPGAGFLGDGSIIGDNYLEACASTQAGGAEHADALIEGLRGLLLLGGAPVSIEYPGLSAGGPRWYRCLAAPMAAGPFGGAVLMHIDITEIKSMEATLRKLVGQKSTLLREVNHRVKNSLQLVSSLLTLQTMSLPGATERAHFQDARARIDAIARVHSRLYQTEQFQTIEFGSYLNELCTDLSRASGATLGAIAVKADRIDLPIDQAAPLGLIANELITNAIKHRGAEPANILVELRKTGAPPEMAAELIVSDQGPGLPDGFDMRKTRSLGMRLITSLTGQIDATVSRLPVERGTSFRIVLTVGEPRNTMLEDSPAEING